jgi:hypothetical protein
MNVQIPAGIVSMFGKLSAVTYGSISTSALALFPTVAVSSTTPDVSGTRDNCS